MLCDALAKNMHATLSAPVSNHSGTLAWVLPSMRMISSYGGSPIVVKHREPNWLFRAACVHCTDIIDAIDAQIIRSHAYDRSQELMRCMKRPILCFPEANRQNPNTGIGGGPVGVRNKGEWREICWVDDVSIDQEDKKRHN
jgi:hypothetical protein